MAGGRRGDASPVDDTCGRDPSDDDVFVVVVAVVVVVVGGRREVGNDVVVFAVVVADADEDCDRCVVAVRCSPLCNAVWPLVASQPLLLLPWW